MGLIGCYLYPALRGGTTYGFAPTDFIQRPVLWFDTINNLSGDSHCRPQLRLRLLPARREAFQGEPGGVRPQLAPGIDVAAEPVKPDTYTRFLEAFQPYGLKSESFYAAYGLAENTLAVSLGGRNIVSVNKHALALGKARMTTEVSEIDGRRRLSVVELRCRVLTSGSWIRNGTSL